MWKNERKNGGQAWLLWLPHQFKFGEGTILLNVLDVESADMLRPSLKNCKTLEVKNCFMFIEAIWEQKLCFRLSWVFQFILMIERNIARTRGALESFYFKWDNLLPWLQILGKQNSNKLENKYFHYYSYLVVQCFSLF